MQVTTTSGYVVKEVWDCDSSRDSLDIYEDGGLVCSLFGKSLSHYENEDGSIDMDMLEGDILDEIEK